MRAKQILVIHVPERVLRLNSPHTLTLLCFYQQDVKDRQDSILCYDPKQAGLSVPILNLLLCGGVGAGKSSIVSTIASICKGRTSRPAPHGTGTGSYTHMLRKYSFHQPGNGESVKWQLWDTMGWGVDDYKRGELGFILDGNLPDKCYLSRNVSIRTEGFNIHPKAARPSTLHDLGSPLQCCYRRDVHGPAERDEAIC